MYPLYVPHSLSLSLLSWEVCAPFSCLFRALSPSLLSSLSLFLIWSDRLLERPRFLCYHCWPEKKKVFPPSGVQSYKRLCHQKLQKNLALRPSLFSAPRVLLSGPRRSTRRAMQLFCTLHKNQGPAKVKKRFMSLPS